jgi:phosphate transport system substrate-binding protein
MPCGKFFKNKYNWSVHKGDDQMIKKIVMVTAVVCTLGVFRCFAASDLIKIDGSSTVFPITEAVSEEFQTSGGGAKVMVGISGTGGGFKRFCRGETDISNASRPIKAKEIDACKEGNIKYIEIPIAYDGLAVVVNPKNTWVDHLTTSELKTIWEPGAQGVVTKWSQVRSGFPDTEIDLFGPGTDSGTFDYFTEAINGKAAASRGDYTASEDDNVLVEGVSSEEGGLGYFGIAYYEQNKDKLKLVPIDAGKGPITPSKTTVMDGTYAPLSRKLFIYVSDKAIQRPAVRKYVEYYIQNAATLAEEVGYISLTSGMYDEDLTKLQAFK